ncbi:FAD-binding oxidoreductase [Verrucosispora sp. WMMD1129]|uniref:FAD-binding oxidoreductase n=1 Tax=Verrucosispora sp. WMMD1129 TaxID=3016093 RepID=UPI00249A7632|nr:FAD-binding oxidoreductase [Verrucosispora sp. WMMD1129]WFE44754.1 FAD-binding oxidoreductase [Verrucosispora sp. WMMD1129]
MSREAVTRWLRLVEADAELSAYLIGVDRDRLAAHLTRQLAAGGPVLDGWPGLPEAQRRRAADYLAGVLAARDHPVIDEAAARFRAELRCPGLLPERATALVVAALARLVGGGGDRAGRLALLAVLGRVHRRYRLRPEHGPLIGAALATVAPRLCPAQAGWEQRWQRAWALVERAAGWMGDGPAFWPAEVVGRDLAAEGIAILTVRPWRRLPFRPGQAVPVCVPQHPGRWRWYCPANAPRPDGTVELHVRAVPAGTVSRSLVHEVRPDDLLHLGPPVDIGLSLPAAPELSPSDCPDEPASARAEPARAGRATARDLLLVAGGTGLAPLRALVEQVATAPAGRRVTLIVGVRTIADLYDAITLDKLDQAHPWLTVVPTFSHDPFVTPAEQGDALTLALDRYRPNQHVYVCGPPTMLDLARHRLPATGIPAYRIHLPTIR